MDGLIVLFIIMGIVSSLKKKKKKQEEKLKQYQRDNTFAEVFPEGEDDEILQTEKIAKKAAEAAKKIPEPVKKAAAPVIKQAAPVIREAAKAAAQEIPFTKEEWDKFLGSIGEKKPAAVKAEVQPSPEGRISLKQAMPEGFSPKLKSTQGESEEEHRRHLEKIARQEKLRQEKLETAQEIRSMNRQKMRQAVVMSEILGKPVALRGKRG